MTDKYYIAHLDHTAESGKCFTHFKFAAKPEAAALTALRIAKKDFGDVFVVDLCDRKGRYILTIYSNGQYGFNPNHSKGEVLFPNTEMFFVAR